MTISSVELLNVRVTERNQFGLLQRWMTGACLLLVLMFASLEAVHFHSGDALARGAGNSCLICMSVHNNAPAPTVHVLPVLFAVGLIVVACKIETIVVASRLPLFTRPPPSF